MKRLAIALLFMAVSVAEARDPRVVREFRRVYPCPTTGRTTGACPGWVVDHKYPLCAGGADSVDNMQWQSKEESFVKDRIERELCLCRAGRR